MGHSFLNLKLSNSLALAVFTHTQKNCSISSATGVKALGATKPFLAL